MLVRPMPPTGVGGTPTPGGATPPPTATPPSGGYPVGSMPPYRLSPTTLPTPALQAIQDSVFGHTAATPLPGMAQPIQGGGYGMTTGGDAYHAGHALGQAITDHLRRVDTASGVPNSWYGYPGGNPGGPPGPPVQGLPAGFPDLQAVIDYMRGRYPGMY